MYENIYIMQNTDIFQQNGSIQISGSKTCSSSTQYSGYYRCVWTSSNSLDDGSYTYILVVTTITQASPLTGSFKIGIYILLLLIYVERSFNLLTLYDIVPTNISRTYRRNRRKELEILTF